MTKPKTGKEIMTDEEIIKEYDECHIAIEEVIKIAREQGRAEGKDEEKVNLQKKSYQQLKFYDSGYLQGQSDIKARLMSKEVLDKICVGYDDTPYILAKDVMKQALAEAERK